jgi:UDP-N-acetyl-2-amino-2-deoxyglucuronate dehydrogenase
VKRKYRCGLIGCGRVSGSHVSFYPGWDRAELVTCADPSAEARSSVIEILPGCRGYDSSEKLLEREELDLVVIATRPNLHHSITVAAAEAGVGAILCEKPMALDLGTAGDMVRVCRERGVHLAIGHQRRYDPQYRLAMETVTQGGIGQPIAAETYWPCSAGHFLGGHTRGVDGGGFIMYLGVHVFDMLHFCLGNTRSISARLGKKSAESDVEDSAVCLLTLENGVPAIVHLGEFLYDVVGAPPGSSSLRFFITGTEGSVTFGDFSLSVWHRPAGASQWTELPPPPDFDGRMGFQQLHEALYHAIKTGEGTLCDGEKAIQSQRVAMGCYESALRGGPVDIAGLPDHSPPATLGNSPPAGIWRIGGL